ncbi:MAG TPA: glycosyltransferase [Phycisphaeraceae bacterium]
MTARPPISAIVIFRNERRVLERCLQAVRWCDEVIAIDMESSDGSADLARRYADRMFRVPAYPIAEPTRVAAAAQARHDWVLLVDPDEIIPAALSWQMMEAIAHQPHVGAVRLPMRFYFKRRMLTGTIWGKPMFKRMLIHRKRCRLLPHCNRISELLPGYDELTIPHSPGNHVRHEWSDSYLDLLHRHFRRYAHLEAKALVAQGERFGFRRGVIHPLVELRRCLKDYDGWRMGLRGLALSAIYFGYTVASDWLTLYYQRRSASQGDRALQNEPPTLVEQAVPQAWGGLAA